MRRLARATLVTAIALIEFSCTAAVGHLDVVRLDRARPLHVCIAAPAVPGANAESRNAESSEEPAVVSSTTIGRLLKEELEARNLFTRVTVVDAAEATLEQAQALGADMLLRIEAVEPPLFRFERLGSWFVPNTVLWFALGLPSWWVQDRVYEVSWDLALSAQFVNVDRATRLPPELIAIEVPMSVVDQGVSWTAFFVPPAFYEGPDLQDVLTLVTEDMVAFEFAEILAREESIFECPDLRFGRPRLEIAARGRQLRLAMESRDAADRFVAMLDGEIVLTRDALDMIAPDAKILERTGRRVYEFEIPLEAEAGEHELRVLAHTSAKPVVESIPGVRGWDCSATFRVSLD